MNIYIFAYGNFTVETKSLPPFLPIRKISP